MLDKLDAIKAKFDELGVALTNPEIVRNRLKIASTVGNAKSFLAVQQEFGRVFLLADVPDADLAVGGGPGDQLLRRARGHRGWVVSVNSNEPFVSCMSPVSTW